MTLVEQILGDKTLPPGEHYVPATADELARAETEIGVEFPESLRQIQLLYGPFMFTDLAQIRQHSDSAPEEIFSMFGCAGDQKNLVTDYRWHTDLQAKGLIPFADDVFNNRFVFDAKTGEVSFVDYSDGGWIRPMAASFDEFLKKIQFVPEE